jgi:hypothetical protein
MTAREQLIAASAGGVTLLFVVGLVGYFVVLGPAFEKESQALKIETEAGDLELQLAKFKKEKLRLDVAVQRSLPANPDVARVEYDAALADLLRDSGVPRSAITIHPSGVSSSSVPEIAPKTPAYKRLGVEIVLKKVSLANVIDVLRRYYALNLLQQITKFTVKHANDANDVPPAARGSRVADVADLDVTLVTEAIILDGAEPRRSLLPVSPGFTALGGGVGLAAIQQSPKVARGLTPMQLAQTLASADRDYSLLLVKDIFHGPPPPPAPEERVEVVPPKEDTSPYIRLSGLGQNPDGSGTAVIEDLASKQEYFINVSWVDSRLVPEVTKFYYTLKGQRRSYEGERTLEISESSSGTNRKFRVVGFADGGLVLVDLAPPGKAGPTPGGLGGPPGGFGGPPGGGRTRGGPPSGFGKVPAVAAVVGGTAMSVPPERVYAWKLGQTLAQVTELTGSEKEKALRAAQGLPANPDSPTPPAEAAAR